VATENEPKGLYWKKSIKLWFPKTMEKKNSRHELKNRYLVGQRRRKLLKHPKDHVEDGKV